MKTAKHIWMLHFKDSYFIGSFILAFVLLVIAGVVNFYAATYATNIASSPVTDLILSNIRVYNVEDIFVYGPWVFWFFIAGLCALQELRRVPFMVKSIALFILIRSVFISLTHIGPFPTEVVVDPIHYIKDFYLGGDLFFSAHTGLPFLMALVFWDRKYIRYLFIATAVFFGIIVLMGHLHYSIDVLSAFFITYSIYRLCEIFFKRDQEIFLP